MRQSEVALIPKDVNQFGGRRGGRDFRAAANARRAARADQRDVDAEICRVQGVLTPSADSHIEFEVWLPTTGWNGKYLGTGNGGFAGEINYFDMIRSVGNGYATSSTDTGHQASAVMPAGRSATSRR